MAGITVGAPYHTWWCTDCFNAGKHKDPHHHGHLTRNEQFSVAKAMGLLETYQPTTQYTQPVDADNCLQVRPTQTGSPMYNYQGSGYSISRPSPTPTHESPQSRVNNHNTDPQIEEYSVGWICAIDTEYVAACELLEKEFSPPQGIPELDDNYYTYGRIGPHNVVMACLPWGRYGMTSATGAAINMRRTFSHLRIRLMVGTGGGAPSKKNDIRLGDVVVSIPIGRTGGVIHYESGKTIQNRQFERTGHLDAPPKFLLNAVNALDTSHQRRGHTIQQTVRRMVEKNPRLSTKYCQPDPRTDVLHQSTWIHLADDLKCFESCSLSENNIVQRPPREAFEDNPKIHYGLIASADRLVKDATVRNHLAQTEDVMCFEMEAAGLMGDFPCLVIRGICNYSDTHKYDFWQGYAAATAAAYAKELLVSIPPALPARET